MAMSKKDYQAIARAIHGAREAHAERAQWETAREAHAERAQWETEVKETVSDVTERIANVLRADNARFNRALFVEACETGRCRGMKG